MSYTYVLWSHDKKDLQNHNKNISQDKIQRGN